MNINNFKKSKVVSITKKGRSPTMDLTISDDNSYVANGIVVHNSNRYRHITVANIPRATSIYGKEMRSLFGAGKDYFQIGFDFSSWILRTINTVNCWDSLKPIILQSRK